MVQRDQVCYKEMTVFSQLVYNENIYHALTSTRLS